MGIVPAGRTVDSMRNANSKTLAELEARGLACYGLHLNHNFHFPDNPNTKGLLRSKSGNITIQLLRDTTTYGGMPCKGFKPGERVLLKKTIPIFLSVNDSRDCENNPNDETAALGEIVRITPKLVEIMFLSSLPYFINEDFTSKARMGHNPDYYLTKNKEISPKNLESLKLRANQIHKLGIGSYKNSPLTYILDHWSKDKVSKDNKSVEENITFVHLRKDQIQNKLLLDDTSKKIVIEECLKMFTPNGAPVTIIHGPPGTGKTTCLAEAICQIHLAHPDKRILCVGPSHAAADNLCIALGKYFKKPGQLYRLARLSKITDERVVQFMPDISTNITQVQKMTKRVLDNAKLLRFSEEEYALQEDELRRHEKYLKFCVHKGNRQMLENATITCCVMGHLDSMGQNKQLRNAIHSGQFDIVCIDEAGFVKLQQGLDIMQYFKQCILAGDHLQLPPVIKSTEAMDLGFQKSFMEWMVDKLPTRHFMLDTQYRSHKMISGWSSKVLYDGKLKAGANNRNMRLKDTYKSGCSFFLNNPFVWIDHAGFGLYEGDDNYPDQHESFFNKGEAEQVAKIYHHFRNDIGIPADDIGVISCYWAQVAHIREALEEIDPSYAESTVRTIDGYQGKEKDVIIVSFARSNLSWALGMMSDVRRINVAITRARRLCCIVGDSNTFSYNENYETMLKGLRKKRCVLSLREYKQQMDSEGYYTDDIQVKLSTNLIFFLI